MADFMPKHVVDVGCGTGALLQALQDRGCDVFGLEHSKAGLGYCKARNINVVQFDLEKDVIQENWKFDVAVSMEVAEHLPEGIADSYVDMLTRMAPVVVFTAATPGQRGHDHVNLQPRTYWVSKYERRGFNFVSEITERWRENWKSSQEVEWYYWKNLMIFRRLNS
jgi:cyclopropane fatty-acyl-phospholipid synthase-like methyltransferase